MALVLAHFMNIFQSSPALTLTAETTTKARRSFIGIGDRGVESTCQGHHTW